MSIKAWVAKAAKQKMVLEDIDLGALGTEEVEVAVEHCGLCHSDVSVLNNDWGISQYPAILGHEVVGRVTAVGTAAKGVKVGQRVGVGWTAASCMHCRQCLSGDQHLCPEARPTILGHRGGFASRVRCHWAWAIPLPEGLNFAEAGPLLCGGITVFHPLESSPGRRATSGLLASAGSATWLSSSRLPTGANLTARCPRPPMPNQSRVANRLGEHFDRMEDGDAAAQERSCLGGIHALRHRHGPGPVAVHVRRQAAPVAENCRHGLGAQCCSPDMHCRQCMQLAAVQPTPTRWPTFIPLAAVPTAVTGHDLVASMAGY